jgi:uncharacterized membrane protein HdeD (DUF308 family)
MQSKGLSTFIRESEGIRNNWGWFFVLGLLLMFLGIAVMGSAYTATIFSVLLFGFLIVGAGVVQLVQAILAREWSGLFLSLLLAVLYVVTGLLCIANPTAAALSMTYLIAIFCFIGGLFKMLVSLIMRFESWGWVFFNGIVTFILGVLIYSEWPLSGLWLIGTFVGVDMFLSGWSWILLSLAARRK